MGVDREAREKLAGAVAAFLRGETDNWGLDEVVTEYLMKEDHDDDSLVRISWEVYGCYDEFSEHKVSLTRSHWDWLVRQIAFLRTDLHATRIRWKVPHRRQRFALLFVGVYACTGLLLRWFGLDLGIAAYALLGVAWPCVRERVAEGDLPLSRFPFAPFRSEKQWRRYEHSLADLELPAYDPALHALPYRSRREDAFIEAQTAIPHGIFHPASVLWNLRPIRMEIALVDEATDP